MLQRTDQWDDDRLGKATASNIATIMVKTKKGYGAGRETYMLELLAQRLTGSAKVFRKNKSIMHGEEMEQYATAAYEADKVIETEETGFIDHPNIKNFGASPDRLVGDKGLLEIKCLDTDNHIKFLIYEEIDREFLDQMHCQMLCTQREWCDFVSFDDRIQEEHLRYKCVRVHRDITIQIEMAKEVGLFLNELDQLENQLLERIAA